MRALTWMLDLGRSTGGKIVSLLLALAMIFSYSNIFVYSAEAFATEGDTVELLETGDDQPEKNTDEGTESENQNEDFEKQADISGIEIDTDTNITDGIESETNSSNNTEDESIDQQDPIEPIVFDEASGALTIKGKLDVSKGLVAEYKTLANKVFIDIDGSIEENTFREWKSLDEITIKCTGAIGEYAVWNTSVKKITVENAESLGNYVFGYNGLLEEISINNVPTVPSNILYVWAYCPKIVKASFSNIDTLTNLFQSCPSLVELTLDNVNNITANAFSSCSKLTNVDLSTVSRLGQSAFAYCDSITEIVLDDIVLDATPFYSCKGLQSVTISNVATIPSQAFYNCTSLEKVTLSDIKLISENILQKCSNDIVLTLTNIDVIASNAFNNCDGIKTVEMTGIDNIGQYAFGYCDGLQSVVMNDVRYIDNYVFWYCKNLETINSLNNVTERINGFALFGCEKLDLSNIDAKTLCKMGFIGSNESIMSRVQAILAGKFKIDDASKIDSLTLDSQNWTTGDLHQSDNWDQYNNGTQISQQARWATDENGVANVQVDAYYTGEQQVDYVFVADLSASMAQLGNAEDNNARFYDMQSKLLDMTTQLLNTPGYDCKISIVTFGGMHATETCDVLELTEDSQTVENHIKGLKPLNENTDYGLGLEKAYDIVAGNTDRNTVIVFLSDGAPNVNGSKDQHGTSSVKKIKKLAGDNGIEIPIYGVLHSPTNIANASAAMNAVCDKVYAATDTWSFGDAMDAAFTSVYGDNTITIPVNAADFDVVNIQTTAGTATLENGVITWTLHGMPFTDHQLTYDLVLKDDLANRVGTYSYAINNGGDASFNIDGGASAGVNLRLSRTVVDQTPIPTPNPGTDTTTTTTTTTVVAPATPATPAPAPALAVIPVVATPIADDPTPMAAPTEENIADDENPLASVYDEPHCWVHFLIIFGMIITVIYGAAVAIRRSRNDHNMGELERKLTEEREISYSSSPAKHHA